MLAASPNDWSAGPGVKMTVPYRPCSGPSPRPGGPQGFLGPPGSVEIFEIHTVCPLMCEGLQQAGQAGPPAYAGWCPRLRALGAN